MSFGACVLVEWYRWFDCFYKEVCSQSTAPLTTFWTFMFIAGVCFALEILFFWQIHVLPTDRFGFCYLAGSSAPGSTGSVTIFSSVANNLLWFLFSSFYFYLFFIWIHNRFWSITVILFFDTYHTIMISIL